MISEIFMGLHSDEYTQKVYDQVVSDSGKDGFDGGSSIAIFGDDEVWDVWQIEGPNMVSYFRGKPHVHAWLHIREPQKA